MPADNAESEKVYRLLYFSRAHLENTPNPDQAFHEILGLARKNNAKRGITGCLLACNGWFLQILEGGRENVQITFETIRCDPRHENVVVVKAANTPARTFPFWSMCGQLLSPTDDAIVRTLENGDIFDASKLVPPQAVTLLKRIQFLQEWQPGPS